MKRLVTGQLVLSDLICEKLRAGARDRADASFSLRSALKEKNLVVAWPSAFGSSRDLGKTTARPAP